jgi:hypothetical protein
MESPFFERQNISSVVSCTFWENPHLYLHTNIKSNYKTITMLQITTLALGNLDFIIFQVILIYMKLQLINSLST